MSILQFIFVQFGEGLNGKSIDKYAIFFLYRVA